MQVSGPVKEDTVTGPKIAAVERREARVPVIRHAAPLTRRQLVTEAPTGAPLPRACEGEKKEAPPRASLTIGVEGARLQACGHVPEFFSSGSLAQHENPDRM